jgi:CheY-like chemotaxis protein
MEKTTILIVDDEKDMAKTLAASLRPHVGTVLVAHNGQEAWDKLLSAEGSQVDLVVCDISMPVLTGIELFQRVRASGSQTPFIFLTGNNEKAELIEKMKLGYCETLRKPEGISAVKDAVGRAIHAVRSGLRRAG